MIKNYTYEIISVDTDTSTMVVKYSAEGYEPIIVSSRLPYSDETLIDVIKLFSPLGHWATQTKTYLPVDTGTVGEITLPPPPTEEDIANAKMWAEAMENKHIAKVLVRLGVLKSDPTEIGFTNL